MNRTTKTVLLAYGGFAVVNLAVAYMTSQAKTGRQPGQNALLDFNDSLTKFNLLARFMPLAGGAMVVGTPAGGAAPTFSLPAPVVTDTPGGTTTYYG
jgi:hypothetical protein